MAQIIRRINAEGRALIKQWEGCKLSAYLDGGGVLTIGYGHTGPDVTPGLSISQVAAEKLLADDLAEFEAGVTRLVKVDLTDNQFAALVSFAFNVGLGALQTSTLLRRLNAGDYSAVPSQLMRFVYDNGKKVAGLVNRRAAEAGLWAKGSFVASNFVSATSDARKKTRSGTILTASAGAGAAISDAASQLAPFAGISDTLTYVFVGLALAGLGYTIWTMWHR